MDTIALSFFKLASNTDKYEFRPDRNLFEFLALERRKLFPIDL